MTIFKYGRYSPKHDPHFRYRKSNHKKMLHRWMCCRIIGVTPLWLDVAFNNGQVPATVLFLKKMSDKQMALFHSLKDGKRFIDILLKKTDEAGMYEYVFSEFNFKAARARQRACAAIEKQNMDEMMREDYNPVRSSKHETRAQNLGDWTNKDNTKDIIGAHIARAFGQEKITVKRKKRLSRDEKHAQWSQKASRTAKENWAKPEYRQFMKERKKEAFDRKTALERLNEDELIVVD